MNFALNNLSISKNKHFTDEIKHLETLSKMMKFRIRKFFNAFEAYLHILKNSGS